MKLIKELVKVLTGAICGFAFIVALLYSAGLAQAETKAIFDTINRAFFIATGAQKMVIGTGPSATGTFNLISAGTPVAAVDSTGITFASGKSVTDTVNTAVFAATAVAGTNVLLPGMNVPGATATANHLVLVGSATTVPGAKYEFYNGSTASLKLKMPPGITMNGATAGGTLVVATLISATCHVTSATNIDCRLNVNPTPAAA